MGEQGADVRELPVPPRCRGIPLSDGEFTGCAYGYGDIPPFSGPRDCPTCNGSGLEGAATTIPHSEFGDPLCCGCLYGALNGNHADIACNECDAVIHSVPLPALRQTL